MTRSDEQRLSGDPNAIARLQRVHFAHRRRRRSLAVLEGLDLEVRPGEPVAIVGRSGSGKSTLLDIMAGLLRATSGFVEICKSDLLALDEDGRARFRLENIGMVRQEFDLMPSLSSVENVALALRLRGVSRGDAAQAARGYLERLDLSGRENHRPDELSGGERQRVALARALVGNPRLVLADEPTGSLDQELRAEALQLLGEACADRGLVVVTHDPQVAKILSATTFELKDGRLSQTIS